jgi:RNA polymerase sigma factor (sigma-70 family)
LRRADALPRPTDSAGSPHDLMDKSVFMQACREGGARIESALRALDQELATGLHRECRAVVRDLTRADDLVQETFIKVWQRCATFRGDAELLSWIRGILRHTIIDFFRSTRPEDALEDENGEMTSAAAASILELSNASRDRPEDRFADAQSEHCYRRCFSRFEADFPLHASVMRWIAEDGLSNGEIETLLQRSPGATREFVSQCRKKARKYFAEWYALIQPERGT